MFQRIGFRHIVVGMMCASVSSVAVAREGDAASATTPLPEAVSSFGAVVCDGWIYVYSGHIGKAHDHSKDNLSQKFWRRSIAGGGWEELPMEMPLQGLALVSHGGAVYRVGGLTATNAADEEAKLYSQDSFARFDPQAKAWTSMAPLPKGRSSHDAVVIDNQLYVVGGWWMNGDSDEGEWHSDVLIFDFEQPTKGWRTIEQPFQRRALAATHLDGKLYAIGGMDDSHDIIRSVEIYDPATQTWSRGPELPGEGMNGFGASAWNNGESLLAGGSDGVVYRLAKDGSAWVEAARLAEPRFFHQLVPVGNGDLLALGGASRKGHLSNVERIKVTN